MDSILHEMMYGGQPLDETIWTDRDEALRREFARMVQNCESTPLAELALQVAVAEYPELLVESVTAKFQEIADAVRALLPDDPSDGDKIGALNRHLFKTRKFRGSDASYHDPANCYLNDVLLRRKGMPISLCILYLDIAGRLELSMIGIGLPGHFILRYVGRGAADEIYVDPYHQGRVLSRYECVELVSRLTGGRLPWHDDYLREVDHRYILTRLLNNLKGCYARLSDSRRALRIQNYLLTLHPDAAHELRDRGLILVELQSYRGALADLEAYLRLAPNAPDADQIGESVFELKLKVSELM